MSLYLEFSGAADGVTGSRTLVRHRGKTWLVDCGLFQGDKAQRDRNWRRFEPDPASLEAVILTHAHLDHSGYLPKLVREGFRGRIYATQGTYDLCKILLRDAAYLEEEFAKFANETGYSHHKPAKPLFTVEDAERALTRLHPLPRHEWVELDRGFSLRFTPVGHIIGASAVELMVSRDQGPFRITFSGDVGNDRLQTIRGPAVLETPDVLVCESTYGERLQPRESVLGPLAAIVRRTYERGGVIVAPAFAVGRAQELTHLFRVLENDGLIPVAPVLLDSPMADAATRIYKGHVEDHKVEFRMPSLFEVVASPDDSMLACMRDGPFTVISASGMLNGGRVLHHLKRRLPDERNTVLFSGYQAEGTKGRFLQEQGAKEGAIRIHHQEVPVRAEIATLDGLSAHADARDLEEWIGAMRRPPARIYLNHGSPKSQEALADRLRARFGVAVEPVLESRVLKLL